MKRKIALIIASLMVVLSLNTVAAVTGERGYAYADDSASIITNISAKGNVATLDVYVSGGLYGFTGLSFGYEYDAAALTLLNTEKVIRGESKLDIGGKWLESFYTKDGQVRYFIASTGEFASYKNGESEKLFSLEFNINTPGGENSISYLADATLITCGDTNIYYSPKKTTDKILDGHNIFKLEKDFVPDSIEITDKTYEKKDTLYMTVGETRPLKIKSQAPSEIIWSGTGDAVLISETGGVKALASGKATAFATDAFGNTDDIEIIVQESNVRPVEMKIVCPDTVMAGDMMRPICEMSPDNVPSTAIIWSIEGRNALLLTSDPVFWALSEGEVLLRASLEANMSFYTEKIIKIVPAPKSSEKVVDGSFLVPEKLYAKPGSETATFDITPKLFNVAGAPIAADVYSNVYDIEYTTSETKGITFENGILTVSPDAPAATEMAISAVVKYKVDGKTVMNLESNKFKVFNSKLTDVKLTGAKIKSGSFEKGIYEVSNENFEIMPVSDGQVYMTEIKNGNITDVYFFSSDKKGVIGYNFNYMIKHIRIKVVK
ncbi:MAG: hypothetical protein IKB89_01150 [Clostridia bacterium]|nr:hypothetical protein [Clostridia bacterium]